jgi:predicted nucleic acid-binding protein
VILTDTGPLVALLDRDDTHHAACVAASKLLEPGPLLTTWPCFTEAMYLLGEVGGFHYQSGLWQLWQAGRLALHDLEPIEVDQVVRLMQKYADTPMDLADASLIAVADSRGLRRVFTVDGHFRFYRLSDGSMLEVVPQ